MKGKAIHYLALLRNEKRAKLSVMKRMITKDEELVQYKCLQSEIELLNTIICKIQKMHEKPYKSKKTKI